MIRIIFYRDFDGLGGGSDYWPKDGAYCYADLQKKESEKLPKPESESFDEVDEPEEETALVVPPRKRHFFMGLANLFFGRR